MEGGSGGCKDTRQTYFKYLAGDLKHMGQKKSPSKPSGPIGHSSSSLFSVRLVRHAALPRFLLIILGSFFVSLLWRLLDEREHVQAGGPAGGRRSPGRA